MHLLNLLRVYLVLNSLCWVRWGRMIRNGLKNANEWHFIPQQHFIQELSFSFDSVSVTRMPTISGESAASEPR